MGICGSLMDIYDYPKREAQIKKHCFTKLLDFTDYYVLRRFKKQNIIFKHFQPIKREICKLQTHAIVCLNACRFCIIGS